jgi:hypothetical protein
MSKQASIYTSSLLAAVGVVMWPDLTAWVTVMWTMALVLLAWGLFPD